MSYNVHGAAEIGKILMWVAGFAAFVVVALTMFRSGFLLIARASPAPPALQPA